MKRRDLLVIGGAMAVAIAIPPYLRRRTIDFEFADMAGMPGFRRLTRGDLSAGPDLFAGLQTPEEQAASARVPNDKCTSIFGSDAWTPGEVPIAIFSDYFCPYCAVLDKRLVKRAADGAPVRLKFHELPLLGPRSRWAAQVALASKNQGIYDAVHIDLMQRFLRPGFAGVRDLAERHALDADRLMADAQSPQTLGQLEDGLALGRVLGIPGTPGTMVGRTLVIGAISEPDMDRLIALELETPFVGCPAG